MRKISPAAITAATQTLAYDANMHLRPDVRQRVRAALAAESSSLARNALQAILDNAVYARRNAVALCQDTGFPVVFIEVGHDVICARPIPEVVTDALRRGYRRSYLRASVQKDPLGRTAAPEFGPAIVHVDIVRGRRLKITLLPKGFGSENKARVAMLAPTAGLKSIEDFAVECVRSAGASACPPYIVGIGIGGTQDSAGLMAKKVLLRDIRSRCANPEGARLEKNILRRVNRLSIGPMGFGGRTTALAVLVHTAATHIAGLPVAVNISCHALRSASVIL